MNPKKSQNRWDPRPHAEPLPSGVTTASPKSEGQLASAFNVLTELIDQLEKAVEGLQHKLEPVTRSYPPAPASNDSNTPTTSVVSSALTHAINQRASRISTVVDRLRRLHEDLDT